MFHRTGLSMLEAQNQLTAKHAQAELKKRGAYVKEMCIKHTYRRIHKNRSPEVIEKITIHVFFPVSIVIKYLQKTLEQSYNKFCLTQKL